MKVIVVMPAFNAARTLRRTFDAIPRGSVDEVLLVDDASTDATETVARGIKGLRVIRHARNKGYGGNQKTCYDEAMKRGADVVVMLHPDFQYDPKKLRQMIAPIVQGSADMVIGSRFLQGDPRKGGMHWWRYYGNRLLTAMLNMRLRTHLSEYHSGYRAYSKKLLRSVPYRQFSDNFVFDAQMMAAVVRKSFAIAEVPIRSQYTSDSSSISFLQSLGYGVSTLFTVLL